MGDDSMDFEPVEDPELKELVDAWLDSKLDERPRLPGFESGGDELSEPAE